MSLDAVTQVRYDVEILSFSYIPLVLRASSPSSVFYDPMEEIHSRTFGLDEYLDIIRPAPVGDYSVAPVYNFVTSFTVAPTIKHYSQDSRLTETLRPIELQRIIPHEYNMAILAHLVSDQAVQVEEGEDFLLFMKSSVEEYAYKNNLLNGKGLLDLQYDPNMKNVYLEIPYINEVRDHVERTLGNDDAPHNGSSPNRESNAT
jgi:hypothetical protein